MVWLHHTVSPFSLKFCYYCVLSVQSGLLLTLNWRLQTLQINETLALRLGPGI